MIFDVSLFSEVGSRSENQDAIAFDSKSIGNTIIACIADGVGGRQCGGYASNYAVTKFIKTEIGELESPRENIIGINSFLLNHSVENPDCKGMATTFTACIIQNYSMQIIHVGDSRICLLRGNGIKQLSEDQTEVSRLLRLGALTKEAAETYPRKNVLESALGMTESKVKIQEHVFNLLPGDRIIMTTDGLHNKISKKELRDISIESKNSQEVCSKVKSLMETKKPDDNYSLITISINSQ
jgi:serine/threonine protein phosphatase PrpC